MLEFLYSITIYPFEVILETLLQTIYSATNSYGLAIILLSIAVNIALLPLYNLAEKWQSSERRIQSRMSSKLDEIKATYKGYERHAFITTVYRQHGYKPIYALKSVAGLLIQIPLFLAAYQFLSHYQPIEGKSFLLLANLGQPDQFLQSSLGSINLMPFIMTLINLLSAYIYTKNKSLKESIQQYVIALIFLIALYNSSSGLLLYWTVSNIFNLSKNFIYSRVDNFNLSNKKPTANNSASSTVGYKLYWGSLSLLITLTLISAPLGLLESGSIVEFEKDLIFYMQPLLGGAVACLFIGLLIFLILPTRVIFPLGIVLTFVALACTVNQFAFSGEYSDMSNFIFNKGYFVDIVDRHKNLLVLFILALIIAYLLKNRRSIWLVRGLNVCLIASIILVSINTYRYHEKRQGTNLQTALNSTKLFKLTKSGQNIIIIMMDRMVGGYILDSFDMVPNLKNRLAGFTWYPRTLSPGAYTIIGVPTITGGYDYLPRITNNDNSGKKLSKRLDEAFRVLPYNFSQAGFATSLIQPSSFFKLKNKQHLDNTSVIHPFNSYHELWRKRNGIVSPDADLIHSKLAYFGLFRSSPLSLRRDIYANGTWQPFNKNNSLSKVRRSLLKAGKWRRTSYYGGINSERTRASLKNWALMDDLPLLSTANSNTPDQFYYFSNELVHEPWATTPELGIELHKPITFSLEDQIKYKTRGSIQHVYTVAAAMKLLAEWFDWMKENDVYDNTRIIIVSDHGRNVFNSMFNEQNLGAEGRLGTTQNQISWFHSVLLFKDFKSKNNNNNELTISDKFMTTADVPWMALQNITKGINPYSKNEIKEPTNKLPWIVSYTPWRIGDNTKFKYKAEQSFVVENENIFDAANWRKMPLNAPLPPWKLETN